MAARKPVVALIVAAAENGVIGLEGDMPWHQSSDLKRFRRLTMGKPLIMGRKTFEAIGKPLDGRDNIVISANPEFRAIPGVQVVATPEAAVALAEACAREREADEIMVIGGAQIYAALLPLASRIYLTRVHASPRGDAFFQDPAEAEWHVVSREVLPKRDRDDWPATLLVLQRK